MLMSEQVTVDDAEEKVMEYAIEPGVSIVSEEKYGSTNRTKINSEVNYICQLT